MSPSNQNSTCNEESIHHAVSLLKNAKKDLIRQGKSLKDINDTIRKAHKEVGEVEEIDLRNPNLPPNLETYDPDFTPTDQFLEIPNGPDIQDFIKKEPISEGQPDENPPPYNLRGWWKKMIMSRANSATVSINLLDDQSLPPDAQRFLDTQEGIIPQTSEERPKKRVKKAPISAEFCDISNTSFTPSPQSDKNAPGAVEIFKVFMMRPDRRSALILEVSQLDKQGGVIFSDHSDDKAKKSRQELIERVKKSLDNTSVSSDNSQHMTLLLKGMTQNPESFFKISALTDALHKKGITDPKEVASRIIYDSESEKAIITDVENIPDGSNDHLAYTLSRPNAKLMISGFEKGSSNTLSTSFIEAVKGHTAEVFTSTPDLGGTGCFDFTFTPVLHPPTKQDGRSRINITSSTLDSVQEKPMGAMNLNNSNLDEKQFIALHRDNDKFIKQIQNFPFSARLPANKWKAMISNKEISPPTPLDYHPRYASNPSFLDGSFGKEALPGIFRPCSSNLNEQEAITKFVEVHNKQPATLVDLNQWIRYNFPPITPTFDPRRHPIEVEGYDLQLFGDMDRFNLARSGASLNNPTTNPHCPRNIVSAKRFISLHSHTLKTLEPFIANPLLCTLGPNITSRDQFFWYSIPMKEYKGDLVIKNALFEHNSLSYPYINNSTLIGRCAVCKGLLALPDYITCLAYFWPSDLKPENVTPAIKEVWQAQTIAVCWIHVLSDGVYIKGRKL